MPTTCNGFLRPGQQVKAKRHIDLTVTRCSGCSEVLVLDNRTARSWWTAGTNVQIIEEARSWAMDSKDH